MCYTYEGVYSHLIKKYRDLSPLSHNVYCIMQNNILENVEVHLCPHFQPCHLQVWNRDHVLISWLLYYRSMLDVLHRHLARSQSICSILLIVVAAGIMSYHHVHRYGLCSCILLVFLSRFSLHVRHYSLYSLGGNEVSMLTRTYSHKPLRKMKVTICNHLADNQLFVWPDVWSGELKV